MKDVNSVQLIGRLGQDPEVQYSDHGTACTTFSVATNRTWTDASGQVQTETEWSRCTTWGKLAEISAHFLHKGSRVYVAGRLHTSQWKDAQTGEARSSVEIILDDLILLDHPTRRPCWRTRRSRSRLRQHPAHVQARSTRSAGHPNRSTSATQGSSPRTTAAPTANSLDTSGVPGHSRLGTPKTDTTTGGSWP